ncbi:hypothetical protein K0M31_018069 [Melipona bicolor]|uniref:AMOP domain-containing protein n=1 Tax=Melipona bicolor TaxID=60889 RepID=A0AA40FD39_9HYME|nr:hypothetical protein K0M31_018069 [Melipona bicolor]
MTVSVFVYWVLVFQLILIVSIVSTGDCQIDNHEINGDLERIVRKNPILAVYLFHPSWINGQIRSKRNEQVEDEATPTRHAKHRKRRRYRNRSTYLRNISATRLSLLLDDTVPIENQNSKETKDDPDRNNTILEAEEESFVVNDDVQDSYNVENYDVTDEEKSKIDSKETEGNSSSVNYNVDERPTSTEIEFENVDESTRKKGRSKKRSFESTDYFDESDSSDIYSAIDDRVIFHESLSVLVSKLFQNLRNASTTEGQEIFKELNFVNGTNEDPCQKWLNSKDKLEQVFLDGLTSLPACPCLYPNNIFYDDKIWDEKRMKYFRWRDVSGSSQRLDVYKPGATYCVRSLLTQGSGSAAAQHCCYDHRRKLLTRGSGAGTPYFVSPEISPTLHERIDVLPWRLCKGDFSRYNGVRPPNNNNACEANPDDEEYQRQIDDTKYY